MQTETSSLKSLPSGLRRRTYNVVVFLTDKQRNVGFFLFLRVWVFFLFTLVSLTQSPKLPCPTSSPLLAYAEPLQAYNGNIFVSM